MGSDQEQIFALAMADEGLDARIVALRAGHNLDRRLTELGLNIGSRISVVQRQGGGLLLARGEARVAVGNGLNAVSPFVLTPWAADMEDDVTNINGSGRDCLLEAWYSHTFRWRDDNELEVTGGIIDPAFYVSHKICSMLQAGLNVGIRWRIRGPSTSRPCRAYSSKASRRSSSH